MASETLSASPVAEPLVGAWVRPRNRWQGADNSIHTDAVAKKIGMRGGTIPGTVHLSHFAPLLTELFGARWLARGEISMFYTFATLDGEEVRALIERPVGEAGEAPLEDRQLVARIETPDGKVVAKGTVACGAPAEPGYVRGLPLVEAPREEIRILAAMTPGLVTVEKDGFLVKEGADPDGVLRDPQEVYRALQPYSPGVTVTDAVGFFGATEIRWRAGPVRTGVPYRKTARVVSVGASPKTEFAWFDSELSDEDGQVVAEMRHMTRWMKVSSPKWAEPS
ncbi:hypothetical protein [Phenylobacterium sp.]|uniref:hypothetical protein n=1 Tax=Phenylobacterium sp. TaxID=1871053 RepID=UPI002DEA6D3E|nr:hypothetical protein [Phenylobacterium sp.]